MKNGRILRPDKFLKPVRSHGFTLIELLIAITILAIIATMAYSGLHSVLTSHEILSQKQEKFTQVVQVVTQLQKEIHQIVPRPIHDKYNTVIPALRLEKTEGLIFSFTRAGLFNPSGIKKSSLQRIDYIFINNTLKKRTWLVVDSNNENDFIEEIVLSPLSQFSVEVLAYDNTWNSQWPLNKTSPPDVFPKAIRFSLTTPDLAQITRLIDLPL